MPEFFTKDKRATFGDIIWGTLNKVLEKASVEFREGREKTIIHGEWSETSIEKDSRKEYIQLVEFLSDILLQEFKPDGVKKYNEIIKKLADNLKKVEERKIEDDDYVFEKLELMRKLLRLIMEQIKGNDYLRSLGYEKTTYKQKSKE